MDSKPIPFFNATVIHLMATKINPNVDVNILCFGKPTHDFDFLMKIWSVFLGYSGNG